MIKYHFFGKECLIDRALTDHSDLEKGLTKQDFSSQFSPVLINQIHSSDVVVIDGEAKIPSHNNRPKADAIVTNLKNLTIAIVTADCTPILFFDEQNSVIAAAHAGWQGAFGGVAEGTVAKMLEVGAKIKNIKAVIGPTIRQKSYEISAEFYDRFLSEKLNNKKFFIDGEVAKRKDGHSMFDLPGYVKEKLTDAGVRTIIDDEIDTYSNPERFFSYRRSTHLKEQDCGRNISVIQIKRT